MALVAALSNTPLQSDEATVGPLGVTSSGQLGGGFAAEEQIVIQTEMPMSKSRRLVAFVDVDDTLVRSFGSKRIPMTEMVKHVRELHREGVVLYAWSSGGGDYARDSARELGIEDCFVAFLHKPNIIIDDQSPSEWRRLVHVHPAEAPAKTVREYAAAVYGDAG